MAGGAVLTMLVIVVLPLILIPTIWALIDLTRRPPEQFPRWNEVGKRDKNGWIVAMLVGWLLGLGWIVAIVYLAAVRRKMGWIQ